MDETRRDAAAYQQAAADMVRANDDHDEAALARLNRHYDRGFTFEDLWAEIWRRVYAFRQRVNRGQGRHLLPEEARIVVAQDAGFGSWDALLRACETGEPGVPAHVVDPGEARIALRRPPTPREWDAIVAALVEHRITGLDANGEMTDAMLERVAAVESLTHLSLGGSRQLSDDGLHHLARMPQLESLDLSEYPGGRLTDRGLEVLRHLPRLRRFEMTWQRGVTDAGVLNLRHCDALEHVNVMGTPTGDGLVGALRGKPRLRALRTGRLLTDAGLRGLHDIPLLRQAATSPPTGASGGAHGTGVTLLIDGPFTNDGLASLAGLAGVQELDLFWHCPAITSAGFAHLAGLPNLLALGADGPLTDDEAMRHYASLPSLRSLRAQGSAATDDGYEALSASMTLETFWGRECPHLTSRGFVAFGRMARLRGLAVSCSQVDDRALATLPDFPRLAELTPIDVGDEGFRHIGRCRRLTRLTCMYCRDTTDVATAYITDLPLTYYYAGLTRITDRSLELLAGMPTLEQVDLYECEHVTDAGIAHLARLPRLREANFDGLPGVTLAGTSVFPSRVKVRYTT
jgi:hypothetical protein